MNNLILFIALSFANVVLSTIKTLITVNGKAGLAGVANAITYGVNTYVVVLTADDSIDLLYKIIISMACNFIGVFIVKFIDGKLHKNKLWMINATIKEKQDIIDSIHNSLEELGIENKYYILKDNKFSMSIFAYTREDTKLVKDILKKYNAKYCALETHNL